MIDLIFVIVAAFCAGLLNTVAGGGTFLTFPALVFVGIPPVMATATSTVVVYPGYLGGALGFRKELAQMERPLLIRLVLLAFAGGLIGSLLLVNSSNQVFSVVVPFLLCFATLAFLFSAPLRDWAARNSKAVTPFGAAGLLAVATYGGYFNGGLGIILLALYALWGMSDMSRMNGLKSGLSFAVTSVSVVVFSISGLVQWHYAIGMMIAALAGGYAGAPIARALPKAATRWIIGSVGFSMAAIFFWRLL